MLALGRSRVTISRVRFSDPGSKAGDSKLIDHAELRNLGGMASPLDRSFTPVQNPYNDPSMMESETDKSFSQSTLQQSAQKHLSSNDTVIRQREREINDIAKGIIELADIFQELQSMVIDQGTMLDRIDYNVENMAVDVKAADKELVVVSLYPRYNQKTRRTNVTEIRLLATSGSPPSARFSFCCCYSSSACSFSYLLNQSARELLHPPLNLLPHFRTVFLHEVCLYSTISFISVKASSSQGVPWMGHHG